MSWQDWSISIGQCFFIWALAKILYDKRTQISRGVSISNALILGQFAYTFWSLNLYGSCFSEAVCALEWALIAWQRPIK